jgi:hypothetical protein
MEINPNTKIPGVTRPGRQLVDGINGDPRLAAVSTDRLEQVYIQWMENGAPKNLPAADADGFIAWSGGSIPVHPRDKVQVKLLGGYKNKDGSYLQGSAFRFDWQHVGDANDDVIAFKVVEKHAKLDSLSG